MALQGVLHLPTLLQMGEMQVHLPSPCNPGKFLPGHLHPVPFMLLPGTQIERA